MTGVPVGDEDGKELGGAEGKEVGLVEGASVVGFPVGPSVSGGASPSEDQIMS